MYDFADFLNDNLAKIVGVALAWLAFAILRPGSDARKSRRHIRALRRDFVDQLSRHPTLSESEFESLTYHHVSQLSNSQDALARRWLLRWGVVLLNCSHVVWQLRDWESRSDPLSRVRDNCISLLRGVMSERGVQQNHWRPHLKNYSEFATALPVIINLPPENWRQLSGGCTARFRNLSKHRRKVRWLLNYLITPQA